MVTSSESRGRWALLIGIDKYPNFGSEWQLEGCGNDVAIMQDTLSRRFGFSDDQITVLRDEQATRKDILAALDALVDRAREGDEVVFFYSGHGSQQPDGPEQDELDGKDETLVPYDSGRLPFDNCDISDDEIYLWLLRLTAKTPFVTLIFDCCHSGTILRGGKQRGVPEEVRPAGQLAACVPPKSYEVLRGGEDSPAALRRLGDKYVAFSACGSGDTANEMLLEDRRVVHGALTYFLVETLMDPGFDGATWREVFERVRPQVSAQFGSQQPELEGAQDREVFGVREVPPMRYLPVRDRQGDVAVLGAGKACGLTEGSQWQVYAPATRAVDDETEPVGRVEIFEVGVTSSQARVVEEWKPGEIRAGTRAVESAHSICGVRLAVEIVASPGHPAAHLLAERIESSTLLRKANPGAPVDAWVHLLEPRMCCRPEDHPVPMLGLITEETWVPLGQDGALLAPAFPRRDPKALESLVENLENVARRRGLAGIHNAGNPLEKQVDFFIHRLENGRCVEPSLKAGGDPVFFEGDLVVLEICNRSKLPLYVYVLDIGLTGRVSPVFPALGSHEVLERNRTRLVGARAGEELRLFIPEDFPLLHRTPAGAPVEGQEMLKLFVTPSPADFKLLFLDGMRAPMRAAGTLNDILNATFHGGYGNMRTAEDWVTIQKTFRLRSRNSAKAVA